jgi:multiple sugar transport system ATP-binding protein
MTFALRQRHVEASKARQQVEETARLLGLDQMLDRKPKALSGGQRQRVAMGRALVRQPRVFLLDEPLSNLDAKLRVSMRAELARLHQRYRITTVYVTHDQVEAMTLGDRIAVLDKGRLQQVGSPEDLYRAPANRFVAGFMGSPAMNFATVSLRGSESVTVTLNGLQLEIPDALRRYPGLTDRLGSQVVIGLRPAAFALAGAGPGPVIEVVPLGVESLGDEKHVLFQAPRDARTRVRADLEGVPVAVEDSSGSRMWTAKVTQQADLAIGRPVRLAIDLNKAYFFDIDSGQAIARVGPPTNVQDRAPALRRQSAGLAVPAGQA